MKRLSLVVAILALASSSWGQVILKNVAPATGGGGGGPAFVADTAIADNGGGTTTCAATFTTNTTTGNLLVFVVWINGTQTSTSVTDGTNTFTRVTDAIDGLNKKTEMYYVGNITGLTTPTVTITQTGAVAMNCIAAEYSGVSTSAPLDQFTSANGESTSPSSGNVTTTAANEVLVGVITASTPATFTEGASFNLRRSSTRISLEDRIVSSINTYAATGTFSVSAPWGAVIGTFKQ